MTRAGAPRCGDGGRARRRDSDGKAGARTWHQHNEWQAQERTIWMDGRPHPPEWAPHTWQGFSTGVWEGETLVVTTTHLKMAYLERNGVPRSDKATLVEHYMRHGTVLTIVQAVYDPVYTTEPFVRTRNFVWAPNQELNAYPCRPTVEIARPKHEVPHFLPGTNPGRPFGGRAAGAGFLLPDQESGATIIAHENVLRALSAPTRQPPVPFAAWPSETYFTDDHELFNGESIQMLHASAITNADTIVYFRRSDVISAGDVFSTLTYPKIDRAAGGTIGGEVAALNQILDLAIPREKQEGGTYIIPGHGRVADEADVVEYRDMIVIVRDRVQDLVKKGRSLADIKAAKVTFEYDRRYSTRDWTGDQFVEAVFATLTPPPRPGTEPANQPRQPGGRRTP